MAPPRQQNTPEFNQKSITLREKIKWPPRQDNIRRRDHKNYNSHQIGQHSMQTDDIWSAQNHSVISITLHKEREKKISRLLSLRSSLCCPENFRDASKVCNTSVPVRWAIFIYMLFVECLYWDLLLLHRDYRSYFICICLQTDFSTRQDHPHTGLIIKNV